MKKLQNLSIEETGDDESTIEGKRKELANHASIRSVNILESSYVFSNFVARAANETWQEIKERVSSNKIDGLEDICILAGGSGGRKELSILSDLEFFLISPSSKLDRLVTKRFVKEMNDLGIFVDKLNMYGRSQQHS